MLSKADGGHSIIPKFPNSFGFVGLAYKSQLQVLYAVKTFTTSCLCPMYYVDKILADRSVRRIAVTSVLEESLNEHDLCSRNAVTKLAGLGLEDDDALILLANHKSVRKYGYPLSVDTLRHILKLSKEHSRLSPLKALIKSPFLFAKTGWLYEHAPSFVFYHKYEVLRPPCP